MRLAWLVFTLALWRLPAAAQPASEAGAAPPTFEAGDAPPASEAGEVSISARPGHGVTVKIADDKFAMTLRGRMQVRETLAIADDRVEQTLGIRTVRLHWQGHTLSPDLRYKVQLAFGPHEFESHSPTPVFDAFVEYVGVRAAEIRLGQYFVPFDRARTIRELALQLVDRQLVVQELTLDRDVGLTISSGDLFGTGGHVGYALGVFGGQGRNRFDGSTPGFLYVARFVLRPYGAFDDDEEGDIQRLPRPRLALGVAGAYNQNTTRTRGTTGPFYQHAEIDYVHGAADLVFKYRGFSLMGEVLYRRGRPEFREQIVDGSLVREYARSGWGFLLQGGLMLTSRLEIAGRWDVLYAFEGTDPALIEQTRRNGRELGAGLNYYLNGHLFKIQVDYGVRFGREPGHEQHVARAALDMSF